MVDNERSGKDLLYPDRSLVKGEKNRMLLRFTGILILFIPLYLLYIWRWYRRIKVQGYEYPFRYMFLRLMITVHILSVISIVFFPLPLGKLYLDDPMKNINIVPLETLYETFVLTDRCYPAMAIQVIGNLLMFLPFGFYLPLISKRMDSFKQIFLFVFISSLLIELIQLLLSFVVGPYRSVDIDDLILNTSGGILGYFLLQPFKSTLQELFHLNQIRKRSFAEVSEKTAQ